MIGLHMVIRMRWSLGPAYPAGAPAEDSATFQEI